MPIRSVWNPSIAILPAIIEARFNLQGDMTDGVMVLKFPRGFTQESIARVARGHDEMSS